MHEHPRAQDILGNTTSTGQDPGWSYATLKASSVAVFHLDLSKEYLVLTMEVTVLVKASKGQEESTHLTKLHC